MAGTVKGGITANERGLFFEENVAADRVVTEDTWSGLLGGMRTSGPVLGFGGGLAVAETGPVSMAVAVAAGGGFAGPTGPALGLGYYRKVTAENHSIAASDPTNGRLDRVGYLVDRATGERSAGVVIITGTPSGSPALPSIPYSQNEAQFFVELAQVTVDALVTTIVDAKILDVRVFSAPNNAPIPGLNVNVDAAFAADLVMTNTSAELNYLTPTASFLKVTLPDATGLTLGTFYEFVNTPAHDPANTDRSKCFYIEDNAGGSIGWLHPGRLLKLRVTSTAAAAGVWEILNSGDREGFPVSAFGDRPLVQMPTNYGSGPASISTVVSLSAYLCTVKIDATRVLCIWRDSSDDINCKIAEVTPATGVWTFGTETQINTAAPDASSRVRGVLVNTDKIVVVWAHDTDFTIRGNVINIGSGTTITSVGSDQTLHTEAIQVQIGDIYTHATDKILLVWSDGSVQIAVFTRAGDAITKPQTEITLKGGNGSDVTQAIFMEITAGSRYLIAESIANTGADVFAHLITIAGDVITEESEVSLFTASNGNAYAIVEVTNDSKYLIQNGTSSQLNTLAEIDISGDVLTAVNVGDLGGLSIQLRFVWINSVSSIGGHQPPYDPAWFTQQPAGKLFALHTNGVAAERNFVATGEGAPTAANSGVEDIYGSGNVIGMPYVLAGAGQSTPNPQTAQQSTGGIIVGPQSIYEMATDQYTWIGEPADLTLGGDRIACGYWRKAA